MYIDMNIFTYYNYKDINLALLYLTQGHTYDGYFFQDLCMQFQFLENYNLMDVLQFCSSKI